MTLTKLMNSHDQFLTALDAGLVLSGDALRGWVASDTDDVEEFLKTLPADIHAMQVDDAADYNVDEMRAAVEADRDLLTALRDEVAGQRPENDPKVEALVTQLVDILTAADRDGVTQEQKRDNRKVLIFSYFAETVDYLDNQLRERIATDPRLTAYLDRTATASGPDRSTRSDVITGFAPRTAGTNKDEDRYDLVVTTDVLAEGINLQQARNIINYDLPWNPMRLVQRHGRIDRIGSDHDEVYVRCFLPDRQLDILLRLEARLDRKIKQAAAAVGVPVVLPGHVALDRTFTDTREEIDRIRRGEADLLEAAGRGTLSGEEFRRRLEKAYKDPMIREQMLTLPWAAGSGFSRGKADGPGVVFCTRIGDHPKPWFRYVPLEPGTLVVRMAPSTDEPGVLIPDVVDDLLSCLAHADPGSANTTRLLPEAMREAAFDSWTVARAHIVTSWNWQADPANLRPAIPKALRDAAALVRQYGDHREDQDRILDRLEAPHTLRIQRAVRDILAQDTSDQERVDALADLVTHMNLRPYEPPEPAPPIVEDDVHLVCWIAVCPPDEQ